MGVMAVYGPTRVILFGIRSLTPSPVSLAFTNESHHGPSGDSSSLWHDLEDSLYEVRMLCYSTDGDSAIRIFLLLHSSFLCVGLDYTGWKILEAVRSTTEGKFAFLWRFDLAFNLIAQHQYGDPDGVKNVVNLVSSKQGGYLLVYLRKT